MANSDEIVQTISTHYTVQVMRAFGNVDPGSQALEIVAKAVKEIYRYFEPSFFKGRFLVFKSFTDAPIFDETKGALLYDKNILLNRTDGLILIQVFNDEAKLIYWDNQDADFVCKQKDTLVYLFQNNKESFFANENQIDITLYSTGSRFANQFIELVDFLQQYAVSKIFQSTCSRFSESWADDNRLFFKGGGSGSNIPEKFMQISLNDFLSSVLGRGIGMETSREFNVIGDMTKPKPVDFRVHWREANRTALIELKFIGTVKKEDGDIYSHDSPRANAGISQLKGYHDKAHSDSPTTIIKSFLVVIDGRRNGLKKESTTIDTENGMYYKDKEIEIDSDKEFHKTVQGFEKPIRMFATPICN